MGKSFQKVARFVGYFSDNHLKVKLYDMSDPGFLFWKSQILVSWKSMMLMSFPFPISHKQNNDKRIKVKSEFLRGSTKSSFFFKLNHFS